MSIGNLLEYFQIDILGTLTTQLDVLQGNQKQALREQNLAIFCPCNRKKHNHLEFPLEMVHMCAICTKYHDIEQCPSLPRLKEVFKEADEETK